MTTILTVAGMSCNHCVHHVTEALSELAGVTEVSVTLTPPQAVVTHSEQVTAAEMTAAVSDAGYDVKGVSCTA